MRFSPAFLDDIRARLPVSDVVGKRVSLKKSGREWKGLSPFQQEKTASFYVNDQKGFYHDFSSGKHGDIFSFVMETQGVSFAEAVEQLAAQAGLSLPVETPQAREQEKKRASLHEIMKMASSFYQQQLQGPAGARARGYLADRRLGPATQLRFGVGYAPSHRYALKEYLGQKGVSVEDMSATGMLVHGPDIPVPYDRFRDRVMFPITDLRGRVIAFGGRALDKDVPAKYLNSPETVLFHKGAILFNGARAREAAHRGAQVIVVEGYIDVIALVESGFEAAVAPLGTALTEEQMRLIWTISDEPILCFDGDRAGQKAAWRAVDLALPLLSPGKSLAFATLPEGQDPDDLIRSGGRAAMEQLLTRTRPLADVVWMRETGSGSFETPERRAALEARMREIAATIQDENVRRHYRDAFFSRLSQIFTPFRSHRQDKSQRRDSARSHDSTRGHALSARSPDMLNSSTVRGATAMIPLREALILQIILNHPWLLRQHDETFSALELQNPDIMALRHAIIDVFATSGDMTADVLREQLEKAGFTPLLLRLSRALTHSADWPVQTDTDPADVERFWQHISHLHIKHLTLQKELKDAERATAEDETDASFLWLKDVQTRLSAMDGTEAMIEGFGVASGRKKG